MGDVAAPALGSDFGGLQVRRGGGDGLERVAVAAAVGNRGGRASLKCGSSLCRSSQLRGSDLTVGEGAKKGARGKSCWRLCESAYSLSNQERPCLERRRPCPISGCSLPTGGTLMEVGLPVLNKHLRGPPPSAHPSVSTSGGRLLVSREGVKENT